MKQFYLLVISFLIINASYSQTTKKDVVGKYIWNDKIPMIPCKIDGADADNKTPIISEAKQQFTVIDILAGDMVILIIGDYDAKKDPAEFHDFNFNGSDEQREAFRKSNPKTESNGIYQRYFKVKVSDLKDFAIKYTHVGGALAGGVINFPFKLRLQGGGNDFSSFNLGAAVGYNLPHDDYKTFTYSFLFAATAGNINLDAASVNKNADKLSTTNNFSALTFAFGSMATYDKFQAGVFIGFDRLSKLNNDTFDWKYQNKPWISIGFGYSIFSVQKPKADNADNKK